MADSPQKESNQTPSEYHRATKQSLTRNNFCFTGGMQDYNYIYHGCMEITLEISCCKYPYTRELASLWDDNRDVCMYFSQLS